MAAGSTSDDAVVMTRVPTEMAIGPASGFNRDRRRTTEAFLSFAASALSFFSTTLSTAPSLTFGFFVGRSMDRRTDREPASSGEEPVVELAVVPV